MTTKADWQFRADYLRQQADYLDRKAEELQSEAARYRGLAEQAEMMIRLGDHEGWQLIETAPKGRPIQVWATDEKHLRLPFTAVLEHVGWTRPASRDGLPFEPTHWRDLPAAPVFPTSRAAV